jgi:hypothetical protein
MKSDPAALSSSGKERMELFLYSPKFLPEVSHCIARQREHHAMNTLRPDWEHIPVSTPAQAGFAAERQ